ncbi:Krr1-domain-containing protein [Coniophora puteana RWD-64-598 SS2]|uniref:Krr1-domain-containing protein n=1 Tax=Coniophora puteana (strain RWD-64-598) TaxID=741705 RepID=A0A5M3MP92_CONPW|nr:Krr1-domain-containing protein [Coniophora puteana RWD-64-598 SS2]EIW80545.1 Krr1-domain-containing protein [Coniophora puteana RWD-64-598 SS2]
MLSNSESDNDNDTGELHELTINEHFAKAFQFKKEREELSKHASDDDTDSEEQESEDEDAEELTPAVDVAILRTLARIRKRDPSIYDADSRIFDEERERTAGSAPEPSRRKPKDKTKPITVRQAALESRLLSRSPSPSGSRRPADDPSLTHTEEQRRLRAETLAAFHDGIANGKDSDGGSDSDGDDEDNFLIPREKTQDELEREEQEYRAFLETHVGDELEDLVLGGEAETGGQDEDAVDGEGERGGKKEKKKRKKKEKLGAGEKKKSKEEADQAFLVNYILNRGWIDRDAQRIPTYSEVTKSKSKSKSKKSQQDSDDSDADSAADSHVNGHTADGEQDAAGNEQGEDDDEEVAEDEEDFEDMADAFEVSYNFRFEEPGADQIKSFPRDLSASVRRTETTRKDARQRRKERKDAERAARAEEVRRLKALKMRELRRRLERIGREGGLEGAEADAFADFDLDADWDPEAHDAQMAGLYGGEAEGGDGVEMDEEKPTWDDDIDVGDIVPPSDDEDGISSKKKRKKDKKDKKDKKKKKKKGGDDDDDVGVDMDEMDADAVPPAKGSDGEEDGEEWDGTEEMRKRKVQEYMDEIDALEFNDIVAGQPTRFKYLPTAAQDFGLSPVDILLASDRELNQFMSVKRYAPYRAKTWDAGRGERLRELRTTVAARAPGAGGWVVEGEGGYRRGRGDAQERGQGQENGDGRDAGTKKKRMGKKERMKAKVAAPVTVPPLPDSGSKRKRVHFDADTVGGESGDEENVIGDANAEGKSRKRRRRQKKKGGGGQAEVES